MDISLFSQHKSPSGSFNTRMCVCLICAVCFTVHHRGCLSLVFLVADPSIPRQVQTRLIPPSQMCFSMRNIILRHLTFMQRNVSNVTRLYLTPVLLSRSTHAKKFRFLSRKALFFCNYFSEKPRSKIFHTLNSPVAFHRCLQHKNHTRTSL